MASYGCFIASCCITHSDLAALDPNTIQSVSILKDQAAKIIFGEKAANGVVAVTTKNATPPHVTMEVKDAKGNPLTVTADTIVAPGMKVYPRN